MERRRRLLLNQLARVALEQANTTFYPPVVSHADLESRTLRPTPLPPILSANIIEHGHGDLELERAQTMCDHLARLLRDAYLGEIVIRENPWVQPGFIVLRCDDRIVGIISPNDQSPDENWNN